MKWSEHRELVASSEMRVGVAFFLVGVALRVVGYVFGLGPNSTVVALSHLWVPIGAAIALPSWCWGWLLRRRRPASNSHHVKMISTAFGVPPSMVGGQSQWANAAATYSPRYSTGGNFLYGTFGPSLPDPEPAPPPPEPELVAGPIVGNRGWSLAWTEEGWRLRSHVARHVWEPGVVEATCLPDTTPISSGEWRHGPDEPCPALKCKCGIYGVWEGPLFAPVVGTISAEGRVIPGTKGFRAQKARVQTIDALNCLGCHTQRPATRVVVDDKVATPLCSACEEGSRYWVVRVVAEDSSPVVQGVPASQVLDSLRTTYGV